jgi:head-tail adaptor
MIIGKLRHRVTIQQPTVARGTDGSNTITYTGAITVWAQVREVNQNKGEVGTKITTTSNLEVIMRYNLLSTAIDTNSQLVWEGSNYMVEGVVDDERKIYRTINARLIQ